jgi:hypothetical protein
MDHVVVEACPGRVAIRNRMLKEHVFNLWRVRDRGAVPALVHFNGTDPGAIPPELVEACRDAGIAVASVGFRPFDRGFPLPQQDAVRAVQHIRHHAARFGVDPRRLAVGGTSAGAGIALYCAYHADLADPTSDDPVARESTRVQCRCRKRPTDGASRCGSGCKGTGAGPRTSPNGATTLRSLASIW